MSFKIIFDIENKDILRQLHGDSKKLVREILRLNELHESYKRRLTGLFTHISKLQSGYAMVNAGNVQLTHPNYQMAVKYENSLGKSSLEVLDLWLRNIDFTGTDEADLVKLDIVRFVIQRNGSYLQAALDIIFNQIQGCL
jgi:hypothetical protein